MINIEARTMHNKALLDNPVFLKACELAEIPVTRRQASKFNNGYGAAYAMRFKALKAIQNDRENAQAKIEYIKTIASNVQ